MGKIAAWLPVFQTMRMQSPWIICLSALASSLGGVALAAEAVSAADLEFFEKHVRPVLVERCYECHSLEAGKQKGGLRMDTREALAIGGDGGPALKPGDPDQSLIIEAVRYHNQDMQMPPKGAIPKAEVAVLEQWVKRGAPDPRQEIAGKNLAADTHSKRADLSKHWSFQPMGSPQIPQLKSGGINEVDAFIQEKLETKGLTLGKEADRRTLVRRVTYDLTGLPPTPDEVKRFVEDTRPDAYQRLIERLLETPQYGERWGRHWLDVARYADSNGLDENIAFGTAWRYRDYVVKSFNDDKPFDVFLKEQLAGDLMKSPDIVTRHERVTATAFLNLGAKVLAEPDKEKLVMDIVDEQIDTLGKAFLGLTLGCARCHAHKFDPISQEDYYALAAVFKSTQTLTRERNGAISYWNESPLAGLEEFAEVHSAEQRLSAAKKQLAAAEAAAKKEIESAARARAADYLLAALKLPAHVTLTEAKVVAEPMGLRGEILVNCHVHLKTQRDEEFYKVWWQALNDHQHQAVVAHYGPLFEKAMAPAREGEAPAVAEARNRLLKTGLLALPPVADSLFPAATLREIIALRDKVDAVEKALPDLPTVMSVADAETILHELKLHIRGNHMALGEPVSRGVPGVMKTAMRGKAPQFPSNKSGRLELAEWLTDSEHPLTARVMVNRLWTWHFGQGLVNTPDNFGVLGAVPTHPELLDWLAREFVKGGWSVKSMHRLILHSATYKQMSAGKGPEADLENRLYSVFPIRRLEAEEIRDTVLASAGLLELTLGGKTVPLRNRQFVFNHTSKDATAYDSQRRALYLPVIRNHLYELFQQFDYPDPSMPTGLRNSSVIAPQALIMMNSELVTDVASALGKQMDGSDQAISDLYFRLYARPPESEESRRCREFLRVVEAELVSQVPEAEARQVASRAALCQALLMADELIYLR